MGVREGWGVVRCEIVAAKKAARRRSGPSGRPQTYESRAATGRRRVALWLEPDSAARLEQLSELLGGQKVAVQRAIDELFSRLIDTPKEK